MTANYSILQLIELWELLGDVPVDEDGECTEADFLQFPKGSEVYDIWHWFEEQNPNFSIGHLQNGYVVHVVGYDSNGSGGFDWYHKPEEADKAFNAEKANVKIFAKENYSAYRFDAIVSTLDESQSVKEIDALLDELFVTADHVIGTHPRYAALRNKLPKLPSTPSEKAA